MSRACIAIRSINISRNKLNTCNTTYSRSCPGRASRSATSTSPGTNWTPATQHTVSHVPGVHRDQLHQHLQEQTEHLQHNIQSVMSRACIAISSINISRNKLNTCNTTYSGVLDDSVQSNLRIKTTWRTWPLWSLFTGDLYSRGYSGNTMV